jgi:hypothetical protein
MRYKKYLDFFDINPEWKHWHPPVVRNDPDPNPPPKIRPVPPMSLGELYDFHKRNGTLGAFYTEFGRDR